LQCVTFLELNKEKGAIYIVLCRQEDISSTRLHLTLYWYRRHRIDFWCRWDLQNWERMVIKDDIIAAFIALRTDTSEDVTW